MKNPWVTLFKAPSSQIFLHDCVTVQCHSLHCHFLVPSSGAWEALAPLKRRLADDDHNGDQAWELSLVGGLLHPNYSPTT